MPKVSEITLPFLITYFKIFFIHLKVTGRFSRFPARSPTRRSDEQMSTLSGVNVLVRRTALTSRHCSHPSHVTTAPSLHLHSRLNPISSIYLSLVSVCYSFSVSFICSVPIQWLVSLDTARVCCYEYWVLV